MTLAKVIAAIQGLASVAGIVVFGYLLAQGRALSIIGIALFGFGLWGSWALWKERRRGIVLAATFWALQIPQLLSPLHLQLLAGPYLIFFLSSQATFDISFGAYAGLFATVSEGSGWTIGINLVAVMVLVLLRRVEAERREAEELVQAVAQAKAEKRVASGQGRGDSGP